MRKETNYLFFTFVNHLDDKRLIYTLNIKGVITYTEAA